MTDPIQASGRDARIRVVVQPRASRTGLVGRHGDALRIRLAAPPVDGKANAELIAFMAEVLEVPRSAIQVVQGAASRHKVLAVEGMDAAVVRRRLLPDPLPGGPGALE